VPRTVSRFHGRSFLQTHAPPSGFSPSPEEAPLRYDALAAVRALVQIWQRLKISREPEPARGEVPLFRLHGYPPAPFPLTRFSGGVASGERVQDEIAWVR